MSLNVKMETKVHQELLCFLAKHSLETTFSNIDEIVLSYLVSVVELISNSVDDDDVLDVVELMEMMNAYLPGFDQIGRSEVIDWMFGLTTKLMDSYKETPVWKEPKTSLGEQHGGHEPHEKLAIAKDQQDLVVEEKKFPIYDYSVKTSRYQASWEGSIPRSDCASRVEVKLLDTHSNDASRSKENSKSAASISENEIFPAHSLNDECHTACSSQLHQNDLSEIDQTGSEDTQVRILLEMFPAACLVEARHCFHQSAGNMDRAAQLMLDRQDAGHTSVMARGAGQTHLQRVNQKVQKKTDESRLDNSSCIKSCVLEKYSFIDTDEDKKTHHPQPPKGDAKKLVRYRDGQVVNMKGERFTQVEKKEDSDMKQTYVNLKPSRKYRFH